MRECKRLRLEAGESAIAVSRRARIHPSDLSGLELGRKTPPPGSKMLRRLARALRYEGDPADLLREVDHDVRA